VLSDVNDCDGSGLKVKGVKDAKLTNMEAVFFSTCHLLVLDEIGIFRQPINSLSNRYAQMVWQFLHFAPRLN